MSIDFATLQGLTIPEGVVTKIEDAAGNVLWSAFKPSGNVILEVEKIVSDTYAGETTYTGEEFILLDIYPKSGGTVSVTYGGLTKTITDTSGAAEPNAQRVFFGTFNGVSDSVATPASGTLTIDGDYAAFGVPVYNTAKTANSWYGGIKNIVNIGCIEYIPDGAFRNNTGLSIITIPDSVIRIGNGVFYGCTALANIVVSSGNINFSVDNGVLFNYGKTEIVACAAITSVVVPEEVTVIRKNALGGQPSLTRVAFVNQSGWRVFNPESNSLISENYDVTNAESNAEFIKENPHYQWNRG